MSPTVCCSSACQAKSGTQDMATVVALKNFADLSVSELLTTIAALNGDPLGHVFTKLDLRSLCCAMQVCQAWKRTGTDDGLWHRLAAQRWPAHTLQISPNYKDYREMVTLDNVYCASPFLDLASHGTCSTWRYNTPTHFYQCRLMSFQYDRWHDLVRLCIDARGEPDLRIPQASYIALVEDKPEHEYNPGGVQQPEACTLLLSARGHEYEPYIASRGHFQGTFQWATSQVLPKGPDGKYTCDTSLVFCYANAVVLAPSDDFEADYKTTEILKIPAGQSFREAVVHQCTSYDLPFVIHDRKSWWKPAISH